MLPAHLAENIRKQVLYYLQSTFDFRDREAERAFERFLNDSESGLFKGPWVQLRRPFRLADKNAPLPFLLHVSLDPFRHQYRAWWRLSSKGQKPQPTIVTTGTGSGKTECFSFPILDHCLRARETGQPGIKAIILYPMNALAADQEKRLAKTVWNDAQLRAAGVRVGNYTGRYDPSDPGASADSGTQMMGADHGITHHGAQQEQPPDILLTNYKMLDFLLLRPQDQRLWRYNTPGVLQYLVLDELHTYDGAQGADVACLLRRLKERLEIAKGELCVVGTSATLDDREPPRDVQGEPGDGAADARETSGDRLARFASTLFEEDIAAEAVIGEDRLTVEEIVRPDTHDVPLPNPAECPPRDDEDAPRYAQRQAMLWGGPTYMEPSGGATIKQLEDSHDAWALQLGDWLKGTRLFKYLLEIFQKTEASQEGPLTWQVLVERLAQAELAFNDHPLSEDRNLLVASFFALVAQAKEQRSDSALPLVPTQVQLWVRELRRLGRLVSEKPVFIWLDESALGVTSLPVFHCSECGESGWVAMHNPSEDSKIGARGVVGIQLDADPTRIYRNWFGYQGQRHSGMVVISPWLKPAVPTVEDLRLDDQLTLGIAKDLRAQKTLQVQAAAPESFPSSQAEFGFQGSYLCPKSLVLRQDDGPCPLTGDTQRFRVKVNRDTTTDKKGNLIGDQGCPHCGSKEGVFFIGSQGATLSSVAIDEMFGSMLNSDPKLLAFTDSVQDASHRAGFFTARTYQFTFRTALQHVIDGTPGGVSLPVVGEALLDWWSAPELGRPGSTREAFASLLPPDLQQYVEYQTYRAGPAAAAPSKRLREEVETRLTWQATSEFGLMQTHGRTMEPAGSACLGWGESIVDETLRRLRERLPGLDPMLEKLSDDVWRRWIYGVLHRYRVRGAVNHPYLMDFAKSRFWGKYPFGKAHPGRETHPPGGNYRPHLLVTEAERGHEHVLSPSKGGRSPWHVVWARRALGAANVDETTLLDLIRMLLVTGAVTGLFRKLHQDGTKEYYAISASAARLVTGGVHLRCSQSGRAIVRPPVEAALWLDAPSLDYYADQGRYQRAEYTMRQRYYQDRYHKGALRRVVANEHTGLLATEEREQLEQIFKRAEHADDPNVLTCTSTLEMGIDIGDLSSTMLCSIPPNTASYLQRVGRAGRATGTALIVSVVNQRPHDLFFYGRPAEMLKGKVDPPGCWLDASAVLVRQYLAYCIDTAVKIGQLVELPKSGKQLIDDLNASDGHLPRMMAWATTNEADLRQRFLARFQHRVQSDTRERFARDAATELLLQRLHQSGREFDRQRRDLENARKRLQEQLKVLDPAETEAREEIERELRIISGRLSGLNRTTALEILTDHGLLPNYAFPERGVRFHGAIYNKHRGASQDHAPIELVRPAAVALRELAPGNHFYTHSREFDIQQISIGNPQQPLIEEWAICGACGHMRRVEDLNQPGAQPACPQCGHDRDSTSQLDKGQQRRFIEFARSLAMSQMEHYDSLAGDRSEERERAYYQMIRSYDLTAEAPAGAVGDDDLPFGIEYRASVLMREVNVGYQGDQGVVAFGVDQYAPDEGFRVCTNCGVAVTPGTHPDKVNHRRSCSARRKAEKLKQEGKQGNPFTWEKVYLYRQLRSEAIRLLLPLADDEDIDTLTACIHLGLRLRFEGNPAHLVVTSQILPEPASGLKRYYLMLLDAVPGGTGYLKTLYQQSDDQRREGEGIMSVLRLARDALETCPCRKLSQTHERQDTDGCYRCIRTYHLQYSADTISRERGITLLGRLIKAGERRKPKTELASIRPDSLFGSMLEKKFVDALHAYVQQRAGTWEQTIIRGGQGFRFSLPGAERLWELELQAQLGPAQGVMTPSQPDFLLRCDDDRIKPVAIFTDGFQFHCHPTNRLSDDLRKRRAILESGAYHVWNITWDDLDPAHAEHVMVCHADVVEVLQQFATAAKGAGRSVPDARQILRNGMEQLKAFLELPQAAGWTQLAHFAVFWPLQLLAGARTARQASVASSLDSWRIGLAFAGPAHVAGGDWVYNDRATRNQDAVTLMAVADALSNRQHKAIVLCRLGDNEAEVTGSDFNERWRRFLAVMNLFQFCDMFRCWTSREACEGTAPEIPFETAGHVGSEWEPIVADVTQALRSYVQELAALGLPLPKAIPKVEHFNDNIGDDAFAELAWPHLKPPIAVLAGDQADFAAAWQRDGWKVVVPDDLQARGIGHLADLITSSADGS